jgi:predicted cupin superfamily sugar epimerase
MPEISMNPRAQSLIADLDLLPHPEGGYYREIFRSGSRAQPGDYRAERSALTAIYFLLVAGQHSGWHQVLSDEVWSHLEGDVLELLCFDATNSQASTIALGRFSASSAAPIHVVPAGVWQAVSSGGVRLAGMLCRARFRFQRFPYGVGRCGDAAYHHATE